MPGSGSAGQIESGSETLRSNRGLTCVITWIANLRPLVDSLSEAYFFFSLHALCECRVPLRLHFKPLKLLNFDFNADPDPAFHSNADPESHPHSQ